MSQHIDTIRELDATELDEVAGGVSVGAGVTVDGSSELGAVSGVIGSVGDLAGGLIGGLTGTLTGSTTTP